MSKRLFLLDGMALVYRAHFAFAARPIRTSLGFNTSALFGFTNTLLDIVQNWQPTHLAVALDTEAPTPRHQAFPAYKAQREAMPEELSAALPHLRRIIEAFNIRVLTLDGYEADDIIGTLARRAEPEGFETYMVTPDKDFGQLVTDRTLLWKPGRQGSDPEVLRPADVCARWGIARVAQVVDMLGLMGDTTDNIPGVPGVGEKTAARLLAEYDTLENVLAHAADVKGRIGQALRDHHAAALLSKQLATIHTDAPVEASFDKLALCALNTDAVRVLCLEFEFNSIGRRLFGDDFKAGRSNSPKAGEVQGPTPQVGQAGQGELFGVPTVPADRPSPSSGTVPEPSGAESETPAPVAAGLKTIADVPHEYVLVHTAGERRDLARALEQQTAFCFDTATHGRTPHTARLLGIAFSFEKGKGWYVPIEVPGAMPPELAEFAKAFADEQIEKIGHHLKSDLEVLRWHGVDVRGPLFDTMIAHALVEPEQRHSLDYLAEVYLGYTPISLERLLGPKGGVQSSLSEVPIEKVAEYTTERADVTWQLRDKLRPLLKDRAQERVFYSIEMPVLPALVGMECEGVRVDASVLAEFSAQLAKEMAAAEADIQLLAGRSLNVNSNKQLGEVLFEELKLIARPRRTATGQYATDEQTLQGLATDHLIVRRLLDYRAVSKLKSTYADTLPQAVLPRTGRIHTTFHQAATATGRLSSQDPNLQNIPIRTELGQEIRRAFVARIAVGGRAETPVGSSQVETRKEAGWLIMSADYSQIELRILAAVSREEAMIKAFRQGDDIHASTAARVFGVAPAEVTAEMRRRAKMVNFGIAYGISAFGLAQRLGIPRAEAAEIIKHYFASFPGIRQYMDQTIDSARVHGYVETLTGRRRYLRDITSANNTVRSAAERNAINAPIQGTAADMIKIAMGRIHSETVRRRFCTRMLLQVHDELIFELYQPEEVEVRFMVEDCMKHALDLGVPIVVQIGVGKNWIEAH